MNQLNKNVQGKESYKSKKQRITEKEAECYESRERAREREGASGMFLLILEWMNTTIQRLHIHTNRGKTNFQTMRKAVISVIARVSPTCEHK